MATKKELEQKQKALELQKLKEARTKRELQLERDKLEAIDKSTQAYLDQAKAVSDLQKKLNDVITEKEGIIAAAGATTTALKKQIETFKQNRQLVESLADSFLGTNTQIGDFIGRLSNSETSMKEFTSAVADGDANMRLLAAAGTKLVDTMIQFTLQQDIAIQNFRRQTGATKEYNKIIQSTALNNLHAGITFDEVVRSLSALRNEFTDFAYLNETERGVLTDTSVILDAVGMSFSNQAEIMQTATQGMHMSTEEATDAMLDMSSTAISLGEDVNKLGSEFNASSEFLVRFGRNGVEVFKDMKVTAKALGTDMATLIKVTGQFETFDDAGRAVGRLNAILGGPYLNSIDMLNAAYEDPIAGIEMMREAFARGGVDIAKASGQELMAIASALGISGKEAAELLGKSQAKLKLEQQNLQDFKDLAAATMPIVEKIQKAFMSFVVAAEPLIDKFLIPLVDNMGQFAESVGKSEKSVTNIANVLKGAATIAGIAAMLVLPGGVFAAGARGAMFGARALKAGLGARRAARVGGAAFKRGAKETVKKAGKKAGVYGVGTAVAGGGLALMADDPEKVNDLVRDAKGKAYALHPRDVSMHFKGGGPLQKILGTEQKEQLEELKKLNKNLNGRGAGTPGVNVYVGDKQVKDVVVKAIDEMGLLYTNR